MSLQFNAMWLGIEFIAKLKKCSCSRLAINGGLDATLFNKSKRYTKYGQEHWMSFGSLINVLQGVDMSLVEFAIIYQVLYNYPAFSNSDEIKEIIDDMNARLQAHIDKLKTASVPAAK